MNTVTAEGLRCSPATHLLGAGPAAYTGFISHSIQVGLLLFFPKHCHITRLQDDCLGRKQGLKVIIAQLSNTVLTCPEVLSEIMQQVAV